MLPSLLLRADTGWLHLATPLTSPSKPLIWPALALLLVGAGVYFDLRVAYPRVPALLLVVLLLALAWIQSASQRETRRLMAPGFARYLTKPIRVTEFMDALNDGLALARSRHHATVPCEVANA